MRKLVAFRHLSPGSIGRPCLKVLCPHAGFAVPVEQCRHRYCRANRGFKEYMEDGELHVETLCALDEMQCGTK